MQLPPARPDSEPTEILFYITKHRLMAMFEKIIRFTLSATERSLEELETVDRELRSTYAALPAIFQPRSMEDSIVDTPSLVVTRLCVYFIYQKCLLVLHQKYVSRGRPSSLQTCYDSASDIIRRFLDLSTEFEPGGQLETEKWFMGSITWHDFLLACTTLCLAICTTRLYAAEATSSSIVDVVGSLQMLNNAKDVCKKHFNGSRDTRKVCRLVEATLLKFGGTGDKRIFAMEASAHTDQSPTADIYGGYDIQSFQGDNDWWWDERTERPANNSAWFYMEQFLNLPIEDFTTET